MGSLLWQHLSWALIWVLAAPLSIQFPANVSGKVFGPCSHIESLGKTLGFSVAWPGAGCCGHLGHESLNGRFSLSLWLSNKLKILYLLYYILYIIIYFYDASHKSCYMIFLFSRKITCMRVYTCTWNKYDEMFNIIKYKKTIVLKGEMTILLPPSANWFRQESMQTGISKSWSTSKVS